MWRVEEISPVHDCPMIHLILLKCGRSGRMRLARNKGVILVFVLLFLTLCSAILAQSTSAVYRAVKKAALAQREMQERWAILSIRNSVLGLNERLLSNEPTMNAESTSSPRASNAASVRWDHSVVLGGMRYDITLSDENTKIPIQSLASRLDEPRTRSQLLAFLNTYSLPIRKDVSKIPRVWNDVIDLDSIDDPMLRDAVIQRISEPCTLYGNGKVNLKKTPEKILEAWWKINLGTPMPRVLLTSSENLSMSNWPSFLRGSGLSNVEIAFATNALTLESSCWSVAIRQPIGSDLGFRGYYVLQRTPGFADDHFGIHWP